MGYEVPAIIGRGVKNMNAIDRMLENARLSRRELLRRAALFGIGGGLIAPLSITTTTTSSRAATRTVTVITGADIGTMDPAKSNAQKDMAVINCVVDRLMRTSPVSYGTVEPLLATSWEGVGQDRWRLKLREGVKFENGADFNAKTVKWSAEYYRENSRLKTLLSPVLADVEIIDDHTVDMITKYPSALLPLILSQESEQLEPGWITGSGYTTDTVIGTGPTRVAEWVKGQHVILEAKPDYWGGALPFDRVVVRPVGEASTRANAALAGEGDIVRNILLQDEPRFAGRTDVRLEKVSSTRCGHIRMRLDEGPFSDRRVRLAVNYAVDIPAIVEHVLKGGTPLEGQMQGSHAAYWQPTIKAFPYDPQRARALLAEAGFPNGFKTQLGTPRGRDQGDYEFSLAVGSMLRDVGIDTEVIVLEPGAYQARFSGQELAEPLYYWSTGNQIPDTENAFRNITQNGGKAHSVQDPVFLDIYARIQRAIDPEERQKIALEGITYLHENASLLFGYQLAQAYGVSSKVDWKPRADEYIYLEEVKVP